MKLPLFSSWKQNNSGSIAIIFALSVLPAVMAIGIGVDYSHAVGAKARLQAATDALAQATLRAKALGTFTGTSASASNTSGGTNPELESYFTSNFVMVNYQDYNWWSWSGTTDTPTGKYTVISRAGIKTAFMQSIGISEMSSQASSTVSNDQQTAEIAIVVTAGPSSYNTQLQAAFNYLINNLASVNGETGGLAKVSIVTSESMVKIPSSSYSAWWLSATSTTGCIKDRSGTTYLETNTTPVVGTANSLHYVDNSACSLTPIAPLDNNYANIRSVVTTLATAANATPKTNLPIGLVWGWNMLTPGLPLSVAAAGSSVKKYLIIIDTSVNLQNSDRAASTAAALNTRTSNLCTNIKADGIRIFTLGWQGGYNNSIMSACALAGDSYSAGSNPTDLAIFLQQIGNKIIAEQGYTPPPVTTPASRAP